MDYVIDGQINLTELHRRLKHNVSAIRADLIAMGLVFADANQFAMFATYGFHGPTEKLTMSIANRHRLDGVYDPDTRADRKDSAWNRL